jgi:hypothetical protein
MARGFASPADVSLLRHTNLAVRPLRAVIVEDPWCSLKGKCPGQEAWGAPARGKATRVPHRPGACLLACPQIAGAHVSLRTAKRMGNAGLWPRETRPTRLGSSQRLGLHGLAAVQTLNGQSDCLIKGHALTLVVGPFPYIRAHQGLRLRDRTVI